MMNMSLSLLDIKQSPDLLMGHWDTHKLYRWLCLPSSHHTLVCGCSLYAPHPLAPASLRGGRQGYIQLQGCKPGLTSTSSFATSVTRGNPMVDALVHSRILLLTRTLLSLWKQDINRLLNLPPTSNFQRLHKLSRQHDRKHARRSQGLWRYVLRHFADI